MVESGSTYNVFLLETEHHFLLALSIVEEHYTGKSNRNKLVFLGRRLAHVNRQALPAQIEFMELNFESETDVRKRVSDEIYDEPVSNLFVVNAYRPAETYILSLAGRNTRRHLMQDGALFYNRIEKSVFLNHCKNVYQVYAGLFRKGILFTDFLYYGRFMETSNYIDELWMTHPEYYIGPATKKAIHKVNLFPTESSIIRIARCFKGTAEELDRIDDCLLYLAVFLKDAERIQDEIDCIKQVIKNTGKRRLLIKLHPNSMDVQLSALKSEFGDCVFRNFIAAEVYIAMARNSCIVGCASTALFYYNSTCTYYALKRFYQGLGIYSHWYNINLPSHVKVVDKIDEIGHTLIKN